jgi:hypothetical protein
MPPRSHVDRCSGSVATQAVDAALIDRLTQTFDAPFLDDLG